MEDTICAISTALGVGAISIIRVSGNDAINIVSTIFTNQKIKASKSHRILYGHIYSKKELIDEVLVSVMKAPKTYTMEDVIEINCHGGIITTNKILELLLQNGCRLAEPGEFTKRAFINGRIDLIKAEAVLNLLSAKSEQERRLALNHLDGKLSSLIKAIRKKLVEILANIEVNIDYPEYEDAEVVTNEVLFPKLQEIRKELVKLLEESKNGIIINNGLNVALIGKPNVGKSSILNALSHEEKAIVTSVAGTTRDILESEITINGLKINLIDTAGIRSTNNLVEKIGVEKANSVIEKADLIILVLENNKTLTEDELKLLEQIKNKIYIVFVNKNDLCSKLTLKNIDLSKIVYGNTIEEKGLNDLKNKIINLFKLEKIATNDQTYLSNVRQISLIEKALKSIEDSIKDTKKSIPIDFLSSEIKKSWDYLGEIIGETYQEELLDELFSNFCLGK